MFYRSIDMVGTAAHHQYCRNWVGSHRLEGWLGSWQSNRLCSLLLTTNKLSNDCRKAGIIPAGHHRRNLENSHRTYCQQLYFSYCHMLNRLLLPHMSDNCDGNSDSTYVAHHHNICRHRGIGYWKCGDDRWSCSLSRLSHPHRYHNCSDRWGSCQTQHHDSSHPYSCTVWSPDRPPDCQIRCSWCSQNCSYRLGNQEYSSDNPNWSHHRRSQADSHKECWLS